MNILHQSNLNKIEINCYEVYVNVIFVPEMKR